MSKVLTEFISDPEPDAWSVICPSLESLIENDDLAPGATYYERIVSYGDWVERVVPR